MTILLNIVIIAVIGLALFFLTLLIIRISDQGTGSAVKPRKPSETVEEEKADNKKNPVNAVAESEETPSFEGDSTSNEAPRDKTNTDESASLADAGKTPDDSTVESGKIAGLGNDAQSGKGADDGHSAASAKKVEAAKTKSSASKNDEVISERTYENEDDVADSDGKVEALSEFDSSLIKFLDASGYDIENYMVSPASLRAVLALATAGADSGTKAELLAAAGFEDENEMNDWYKRVVNAPDFSNKKLTFRLLNSVWHNTRLPGNISVSYRKYVESNYQAVASDVSADKITNEVNNWVSEGTNGLIPKISSDLSGTDVVLVNTLYLKSSWKKVFKSYLTEEGDFKAFDECNIKKEFMDQTNTFRFYEDDSTKLVVLPMDGKVEAVFVIGDIDKIQDKLSAATKEKVHVKIPKLDTETSFDDGELVNFLKKRGALSCFTPQADFTAMSSGNGFHISDILQKTKIISDENGIEAAAASAITVLGSAMPNPEEEEPKQFVANEPFKFFIMTSGKQKETLFYGQIVE